MWAVIKRKISLSKFVEKQVNVLLNKVFYFIAVYFHFTSFFKLTDAPATVTSRVELSQYTTVAKDGYLLRSDENLTMQCIYSEANPPANCNFTFHMTQSNTVSSVSGCSISYDLDQSSLVSCTARNEVGSRSSNNETITVVPAQRE